MTKTQVIYHSADFDGIFSREIAKRFMPDAQLIGWTHGDPLLPFPEPGTVVYVIDLAPHCFASMPDINQVGRQLIWIDHHKSSIEKWPATIPGYRIDGVAACRLAWQFFLFHRPTPGKRIFELPGKYEFIDRLLPEPLAVRLAGEYDIWDKRDPDAELFQHGLKSQHLSPTDWRHLLEHDCDKSVSNVFVERLLHQGATLEYAKNSENAEIMKRQAFDIEWHGLKFLACNHALFNSLLFTSGIKPHHDALLGFRFDGRQWKVSLYHAPGKEHHDLSLIAIQYKGGGGHRGACGFEVEKLPFIP